MKRLFFALILVAGALTESNADAQVFRGRVGFGFPHPHGYFVPVPRPIIYPAAPYYGGGAVVVGGPAYGYGYGYRHYAPVYHDRRWYHGRRW